MQSAERQVNSAKSPGFQIQCPLQRELKSVYLAWRCPSTTDKMAILVSVESMHLQRRCRVPEYCRGEEGKLIRPSSEPYLPKGPDKYQRASLGKHSLPQECCPGRRLPLLHLLFLLLRVLPPSAQQAQTGRRLFLNFPSLSNERDSLK